MQFLVIGYGSMGKRRIKNLKQLGYNEICTYDTNYPENAAENGVFFVSEHWNPEDLFKFGKYDACFICTPPTTKQQYINLANHYNVPCFTEVDIQVYNGVYYPSNSMIFHPAVKKIKELLDSGVLGNVYTFTYHRGQHVEDWHPWDKNFWGKNKETSALKELFSFEMAWLSCLFGEPIDVECQVGKVLGYGMDDVYNLAMSFYDGKKDYGANILIDIVSRPAVRDLRIIGEHGILEWRGDNQIIVCKVENRGEYRYEEWERIETNNNIEQMYLNETKDFINICYPYTQEQEAKVIDMLRRLS